MDYFYKRLVRPLLFLLKPETIHDIMVILLRWPFVSAFIGMLYRFDKSGMETTVCGITFPNPVGLAAGFDKDAEIIPAWKNLGFGFVEIGTVTPRPQPGNPRPRLFRLIHDNALINRMGFNNSGAEVVRKRLAGQRRQIPVGGNIGKNKVTPNEEAVEDYRTGFRNLYDVVDYFVVNVSSPNTPDLRQLQEREPLQKLLEALVALNREMPASKPLFLKIAPDLNDTQLDDIINIVEETGVDGIIATNTTIGRRGLTTSASELERIGDGGLSGRPLRDRATEVIRYIHEKSGGRIPIIGVGGIHSPEDALDKLRAGASLVQIYTGFIYEGPGLIKRINRMIKDQKSGQN